MRQRPQAKPETDVSVCCRAPLDYAVFSDGRGFVVCSVCGKVLDVEPKREQKNT